MGKILDQLNISTQSKLNNLNVPISLWGNGVLDTLSFHHEYDQYISSFEGLRAGPDQPPEIFIVVGPINKVQLDDLKFDLKQYEDQKPFVVYIEGLLSRKILRYSTEIVSDLRNHIRIDYEYHKHPVQLDELVSEILSLIKGKDEK